jgi:hypothetical protein
MKSVDEKDFRKQAHRLVGQEVEVITVHGTFRGTLLSVGSDSIIMRTRIRGRIVRLLIRIALIVALFRLLGVTGGSVSLDDDDALSNYPIDDDDPHDDRRTKRSSKSSTSRRRFW